MNKIKLLFVLLVVAITNSNAQIVTLDYGSFSSNDCDVFGSMIPVQGIFHETKVGDVTKNSAQGGLQLKYVYNGGGNNQKGTEYAVSGIDFKKDYKYIVKITAKNNNSYGEPAGLKCNFNPSGIDPFCNGVNYVNSNNGTFSSSSSGWFQIVNGASFVVYTFESDYLSSAQSSLGISTFSLHNIASNSDFLQTMYIKKIEITEVLPPPSFTLSPATLSLPCGDTGAKTFTVTPAHIPSGAIVTYQWNHSGWSFVSETATSITLQPNSGTVLPYSVSVKPYINGVAQATKTCTVSRAPFTTTAQIIGDSYVCDTGIYTINNLPNGVTIQSVNSSSPGIATVNLNANNEIAVTKVSDGRFSIVVKLQNSCSQTATITKTIQAGIPSSINNAVITGNSSICDFQQYTYTISGASHPCVNIDWSVSPNLTIVTSDANSVTVVRNSSNTQHAGLISANISNSTISIGKGVWVGVPTGGISIQKIGSYDFYVGQWTKLKASYVPIMYEQNEPLNLTFEWQIPYSLVKNYPDTAYKDVKPNFEGQLNIGVRALCDCGYSNWVYQSFNVIGDGNGGGGPIIIPID